MVSCKCELKHFAKCLILVFWIIGSSETYGEEMSLAHMSTEQNATEGDNVTLSVNKAAPVEVVKREITVHPQNQSVVIEGETVLRCEFTVPSHRCFWSKNSDIVAITGRYSFVGNVAEGNCSIKISKVQLFDDGKWRCGYPRTDSDELLASKRANLSVMVMPSDPIIVVNGRQMMNGSKLYVPGSLDQYFSISCWSENGRPAAYLQWGLQSATTKYQHLDRNTYSINAYYTGVEQNDESKFLKTSLLKFNSPQINQGWNQYDLLCDAFHPSYTERDSRFTSLHLIVSNEGHSHYYG